MHPTVECFLLTPVFYGVRVVHLSSFLYYFFIVVSLCSVSCVAFVSDLSIRDSIFLLYATLLRFSFSNKSKRKAQIESRLDKSETKATHDTEQREITVKK
jgi:hypothetical protein